MPSNAVSASPTGAAPAATFLPTGQPVAATQVPSIVATGAPSSSATQPPSSSTTEMPSGAIVAGNSVKSTPFSVTYTLDPVNNPSEASFNEVADLTLAYLQSYFESFFGDTPFSVLIKFFGSQVGNTGTGDPARIGFDVTAIFTDDSEIVPSQSDIDVLIDTALSEPAVQALLDQLRALGVQNPFSNTVTVDYSTDNIPTATVNSQVSMNENVEGSNAPSSVVFLISAATAVAVFAAIIIVMVHRRRANAAKTERDCFKAEAVEAAEKAEKYVDCRGAMCSTGTFSRKGGAASFCGTSSVEPKDCDTVSSEENPVE